MEQNNRKQAQFSLKKRKKKPELAREIFLQLYKKFSDLKVKTWALHFDNRRHILRGKHTC